VAARENKKPEYTAIHKGSMRKVCEINPLNAELNPICHLLALLGAHNILHVSGVRVKDKVIWAVVKHGQK
jgi:hypothetical protein